MSKAVFHHTFLTRAVTALPTSHTLTTIPASVTDNLDKAFKDIPHYLTEGKNQLVYTTNDLVLRVDKPHNTQGTALTLELPNYKLEVVSTPIPAIVQVYLNGTDMFTMSGPAQWSDIATRVINAPDNIKAIIANIVNTVTHSILGVGR